jgi:hypothetical protein
VLVKRDLLHRRVLSCHLEIDELHINVFFVLWIWLFFLQWWRSFNAFRFFLFDFKRIVLLSRAVEDNWALKHGSLLALVHNFGSQITTIISESVLLNFFLRKTALPILLTNASFGAIHWKPSLSHHATK